MEAYARGDWLRVSTDCLLGWCLLALAWIDAEAMFLPDLLTLPLILLGLVWSYVSDPAGIVTHAAAALAGYLMFRLIELGYRRWRGREGLGQGDAKLLAAGGAWVGLTGLGPVILIAALGGLNACGCHAVAREKRRAANPDSVRAMSRGGHLAGISAELSDASGRRLQIRP